jgi:TPP-dependent trihydroxycyclohexane-1,2-dione (THcHDO) dehydratase
MTVGLIAVAMGSYWPILKSDMNLSNGTEIVVYSVTAIFAIFAVLGGYSFLRISVRSIADAPDELLDERQIQVRDTSIRYAYYGMGYVVLAILTLMIFGPDLQMFQTEGNDGSYLMIATLFAYGSMPSMVMAWRERDI